MDKTQLAVVGAGVAGTAAAIEAAKAGLEVTLIDEHPIDFALMAQEIPLHFGQRMTATAGDRAEMFSRAVASRPALQEAEEAGVDLKLGTMVWDSNRDRILTLADDTQSWRLEYDAAIFAPGARDLGTVFPGWDKAGVCGAGGMLALLDVYQAFSGQRVVVLGSGELGLTVASRLLDRGLEVSGIVDIAPEIRGSGESRDQVDGAGVPIYTNHRIKEALGGTEIEGLLISDADSGRDLELECDTVCLAIGMVPNIETLYWTGCDIRFEPDLGGFVPVVDHRMSTTQENIYIAGDVAGFTEGAFAAPELAVAQGRIAGISAAESLNAIGETEAVSLRGEIEVPSRETAEGVLEYRRSWVRAGTSDGGSQALVCICEKVTRNDLRQMMGKGPIHPDHIKRLTRAGMGYCQSRRCREQIQMVVADERGVEVSEVELASYRPPFRPLPLGVMQNRDLTAEEEDFLFSEYHQTMRQEYLKATETSE